MFEIRTFLASFLTFLIVQLDVCNILATDNVCGKPVNGVCNDAKYMCGCHPTDPQERYPNCTKYPPKVLNISLTYNVAFQNGTIEYPHNVHPSITVHWKANEFNNEYGLDDLWGFQVYIAALSPIVDGFVGCKEFDSKIFMAHLTDKTGHFNGYIYTFNNSLQLGYKYEVIIQVLPASKDERSIRKNTIFIPDICDFPDYANPPLKCCKVRNVTLERISQEKAVLKWGIDKRCKSVKGFVVEAHSHGVDCIVEPLLQKNTQQQVNFDTIIQIKSFLKDAIKCGPFNLTVKCFVSSILDDCKERSSPVLLDLLNDCVVKKPYLRNNGALIAWNVNNPSCSVVLSHYEVNAVGVSEHSTCKKNMTLTVNVTINNITLDLVPECSYNIIVTCVYQDGTRCTDSEALHLEDQVNEEEYFKLVVSVLASALGVLAVVLVFVLWKCKSRRSPYSDTEPIIPGPGIEQPTNVGISHDSGNCEPCRQAVQELASFLNSTGYFDCKLDLWCRKAETNRYEFNRDVILSNDLVLVVHSHNSGESTRNISDNVELEDFRSQQSFINECLQGNVSNQKFMSVFFEKFSDQYHIPSSMSTCDMFVLPDQLESMILKMLGLDPQQRLQPKGSYNKNVKSLREKVKSKAFHYKTRSGRDGHMYV